MRDICNGKQLQTTIGATDRLYDEAIESGAKGYFVLPEEEQQLLDAIRASKSEC